MVKRIILSALFTLLIVLSNVSCEIKKDTKDLIIEKVEYDENSLIVTIIVNNYNENLNYGLLVCKGKVNKSNDLVLNGSFNNETITSIDNLEVVEGKITYTLENIENEEDFYSFRPYYINKENAEDFKYSSSFISTSVTSLKNIITEVRFDLDTTNYKVQTSSLDYTVSIRSDSNYTYIYVTVTPKDGKTISENCMLYVNDKLCELGYKIENNILEYKTEDTNWSPIY